MSLPKIPIVIAVPLTAASIILVTAGLLLVSSSIHKHIKPSTADNLTNGAQQKPLKASAEDKLQPSVDSALPTQLPPDYTIPPTINGLAPLLINIPTKQNVVFLGIDDGVYKQATELQLMKRNNVKASLFLADIFIKDNPAFFKKFISAGSFVENHTVNHKLLSRLSYEEQKQEICFEADRQLLEYGRRPVLFRPPGGDYNQNTQRAAAACGMKAVILWIAKANGGSMQYQVGNKLQPGDIVLMHFRPEFAADMQAFVTAEKTAGLHTALLEDWIK